MLEPVVVRVLVAVLEVDTLLADEAFGHEREGFGRWRAGGGGEGGEDAGEGEVDVVVAGEDEHLVAAGGEVSERAEDARVAGDGAEEAAEGLVFGGAEAVPGAGAAEVGQDLGEVDEVAADHERGGAAAGVSGDCFEEEAGEVVVAVEVFEGGALGVADVDVADHHGGGVEDALGHGSILVSTRPNTV